MGTVFYDPGEKLLITPGYLRQSGSPELWGTISMSDAAPKGSPRRSTLCDMPPFPEFVVPCVPIPAVRPPGGSGWIHEVVNDGYRLIARRCSDGISLWNRNAADMAARFERIGTAIQAMSVKSVTLDGEAILVRPDGRNESGAFALGPDAPANRAVMVAFDVLEVNGRDLRFRPLRHRRAILAELLADTDDAILFSEAFVNDGEVAFRQVGDMGFKGIVSKRIDRPYRSGSSADWVKTTHRRLASSSVARADRQIGFWP